eukprot:TRINITY_DN26655_c0_g1_i1.p1 TRINITY_DN26655_c0_g1~~TRINITY_DN26655_c0_g1_i1.p1  ORF type:complete len:979 (+),score=171.27 TRINITY_DN26655_c0_g1_i1:74-3010(+)
MAAQCPPRAASDRVRQEAKQAAAALAQQLRAQRNRFCRLQDKGVNEAGHAAATSGPPDAATDAAADVAADRGRVAGDDLAGDDVDHVADGAADHGARDGRSPSQGDVVDSGARESEVLWLCRRRAHALAAGHHQAAEEVRDRLWRMGVAVDDETGQWTDAGGHTGTWRATQSKPAAPQRRAIKPIAAGAYAQLLGVRNREMEQIAVLADDPDPSDAPDRPASVRRRVASSSRSPSRFSPRCTSPARTALGAASLSPGRWTAGSRRSASPRAPATPSPGPTAGPSTPAVSPQQKSRASNTISVPPGHRLYMLGRAREKQKEDRLAAQRAAREDRELAEMAPPRITRMAREQVRSTFEARQQVWCDKAKRQAAEAERKRTEAAAAPQQRITAGQADALWTASLRRPAADAESSVHADEAPAALPPQPPDEPVVLSTPARTRSDSPANGQSEGEGKQSSPSNSPSACVVESSAPDGLTGTMPDGLTGTLPSEWSAVDAGAALPVEALLERSRRTHAAAVALPDDADGGSRRTRAAHVRLPSDASIPDAMAKSRRTRAAAVGLPGGSVVGTDDGTASELQPTLRTRAARVGLPSEGSVELRSQCSARLTATCSQAHPEAVSSAPSTLQSGFFSPATAGSLWPAGRERIPQETLPSEVRVGAKPSVRRRQDNRCTFTPNIGSAAKVRRPGDVADRLYDDAAQRAGRRHGTSQVPQGVVFRRSAPRTTAEEDAVVTRLLAQGDAARRRRQEQEATKDRLETQGHHPRLSRRSEELAQQRRERVHTDPARGPDGARCRQQGELRSPGRAVPVPPERWTEFLDRLQSRTRRRDIRVDAMRKEQETRTNARCTFKPQLCTQSDMILQRSCNSSHTPECNDALPPGVWFAGGGNESVRSGRSTARPVRVQDIGGITTSPRRSAPTETSAWEYDAALLLRAAASSPRSSQLDADDTLFDESVQEALAGWRNLAVPDDDRRPSPPRVHSD